MANPTQAQIDKLTTNATRWDNIVNGSASATVALDSFTVKTVAGYLQELQATNPRGSWGSGTVYALKDVVVESSTVYICTIAHTSGTFATDLAAGKWAVYQLDVTSAITFGDDFTVDTNTLHVDSTTNRVGIGTTSPSSVLQVNASTGRNIQLDGSSMEFHTVGGTFWQGVNFVTSDGVNRGGLFAFGGSSSMSYWNIGSAYNDGTFTILPAGKIGMGKNNPSALLDIEGSSTGRGLRIVETSTSHSTGLYALEVDNSAHVSNTSAAGAMKVDVNSGRALTIDGTGKMGIGTDAPNTKLEIAKTQADDLSSGANAHLYLSNTTAINTTGRTAIFLSTTGASSSTYGISLSADRRQTNGSPYLNIRRHFNDAAGTSSLLIDNNGNIGVGTEAPDTVAILELDSTTKGFLPPRMTETQRDAISTPPAGLIIYNTTDSKLNLYTTSWEEISSTT
jgi:hypothetical protein